MGTLSMTDAACLKKYYYSEVVNFLSKFSKSINSNVVCKDFDFAKINVARVRAKMDEVLGWINGVENPEQEIELPNESFTIEDLPCGVCINWNGVERDDEAEIFPNDAAARDFVRTACNSNIDAKVALLTAKEAIVAELSKTNLSPEDKGLTELGLALTSIDIALRHMK